MNRRSLLTLAMLMLATAAQAEDRTWQECLKRVDRNGDGQIDRFEIMLGPPRHAAGLKTLLAPRFKEIDRNGDGRLSMAEIDADRTARGLSDTSFRDLLTRYPEVAYQDIGAR